MLYVQEVFTHLLQEVTIWNGTRLLGLTRSSKRTKFSESKNVVKSQYLIFHHSFPKGKEIEIDIEPTDKVERIKERVEEKEGIPPPQQRLIFSGS